MQDAVLLPSTVVTVTVAVPSFRPVTTPEEDMEATDELEVDQVTFLFSALEGLIVANSCRVSPSQMDSVE